MKSENRRLQYEQAAVKERIKDNKEKIKMNKQLPYLVGNVVEVQPLRDPCMLFSLLSSTRKASVLLYH